MLLQHMRVFLDKICKAVQLFRFLCVQCLLTDFHTLPPSFLDVEVPRVDFDFRNKNVRVEEQ